MFLSYIHTFRGIAIIIIVAFHTMLMFDWAPYPRLENLLKDILANGTIYFIFIAGFLFQHLLHKYSFKNYMKKKVKNILLPYLFMSIPAIYYTLTVTGVGRVAPQAAIHLKPLWYQVMWLYVTGKAVGPYWFIPMIFLFYLVSPLLKYIDDNGRTYYALPLLLVLSALIHRPENNINPVHSFLFFFPIYLYGMWASKYKERLLLSVENHAGFLLLLWIILFGIHCAFSAVHGNIHSRLTFPPEKILFDIGMFHKLLACTLLTFYLNKYEKFMQRTPLGYFAKISFGIYFIHDYFISLLGKLPQFEKIFQNQVVSSFLITLLLVLASSVLFLHIMKSTFGNRSRYLFGY